MELLFIRAIQLLMVGGRGGKPEKCWTPTPYNFLEVDPPLHFFKILDGGLVICIAL